MTVSSKDPQALEQATTGAGLSGDANDARSPNPAPSASTPDASGAPAAPGNTGTTSPASTAAPASGAGQTATSQAFPDASKPGSELPSEAGKSDKPKVPVPAQDAHGELPSPDSVGEAG